MLTRSAFCAIRKNLDDSGREYIDITSVASIPEEVLRKARRDEEELPGWAECSPLVRVTKITITEVVS